MYKFDKCIQIALLFTETTLKMSKDIKTKFTDANKKC